MPAIKNCPVHVNTGNKTLENHSILTQRFYHITVFSYQLPGHSYLGQSVSCFFLMAQSLKLSLVRAIG